MSLKSTLASNEHGALSCSEKSGSLWHSPGGGGLPTQAPGLSRQRAAAPQGGNRVLLKRGQQASSHSAPCALPPNHLLALGRSLRSGDTHHFPGRRRSRWSHS